MVWLNNSQDSTGIPCGRSAGAVRAQHGNLQCFSYPTGPVRARARPARVPYGALTDTWENWHNQNWQKSGTGVVFDRTGPVRAPYGPRWDVHGLFTISKPVRGPWAYNACIKLYGPVRGGNIRTKPHGARAGPVSGRTILVQNRPGTGREQPIRGPGVWCDWGISKVFYSMFWN